MLYIWYTDNKTVYSSWNGLQMSLMVIGNASFVRRLDFLSEIRLNLAYFQRNTAKSPGWFTLYTILRNLVCISNSGKEWSLAMAQFNRQHITFYTVSQKTGPFLFENNFRKYCLIFAARCYASSAMPSCGVRLSVCRVRGFCRNEKTYLQNFSPSQSHHSSLSLLNVIAIFWRNSP